MRRTGALATCSARDSTFGPRSLCSVWSLPKRSVGPRSLLAARPRQRPNADFLEPDEIAWVMILEVDVADLRPFRFSFRFVPLFARRKIGIGRVKARDPRSVQIHEDPIIVQ